MLGEAFDSPSLPSPPALSRPSAASTGLSLRRRKKIWDLQGRWLCPLVGTCLPVSDMRKLAKRAGLDEPDMSDYTLHTVIVGHCGENCDIAKRVQRFLDERYAAAVMRFNRMRGEAAVLELWREAMISGDVAGPLWAAWSHPDLTEDGGKTLYGDIHMLSHQVGAAARADLRRLEHLAKDNARLRDEAAALRLGLAEAERQRDRTRIDLERRVADAEARAAQLPRRELELAEALRSARDYASLRERAEGLSRRIETLEERNAANARRANSLELAYAEARTELAAAEAALESALGLCGGVAGTSGCGKTCPAEARFAGRCVLCIGGRTGLVDGYRRLVEASGGRFLHHDGGQEESLHRLDAIVAGADAVVCQAGCVSHAAYWRLKEACKKLGKPCVFLKSPGVTSFARGLVDLAATGEDRVPH
jgi:hypothetical protein